ncbi:sensor histidine kinase [Massilia endophytica]|uniref:sensor histidine kinase n=1 Tax=Massilia endophytica TaxID=2899220 RepID=UPI001E3BFE1F|nr:histidine kinase [Massilia endophytica]UGQ47563.1 histidine kinase [Massilia endophytica]
MIGFLLPPVAASGRVPGAEGLHHALRRTVSCTRPQALASAAALAALVLGGWLTESFNWLVLFGALLVGAAVAHGLLALCRIGLPQRAGWEWLWLMLALSIPLAAGAAVLVFRACAPHVRLPLLDHGRVFVSAAVFLSLAVALPLLAAQRQARALHVANLERAALAAQLKSLQAQVEPHFLYNTLANTRYLARHQPEKAVHMLDHLIAYLRAALPDMRTEESTVGRECELAEHYLGMMAIRFGERLGSGIDCPADLRDAAMPPLMLMSLVENAVQHGVEPKPGAVRVQVSVRAEEKILCVLVSDDGAGLGRTTLGSGVGLRNVRERLAALYGERAGVELRTNSRGGTEAELRLPLILERHD